MTGTRFKGFRFKQFSVQHDKCAMKVGTDSIVLGSWCEPGSATRILDIGTGSGILSLMLAQKAHSDARIIAIEPDRDAATQARENMLSSPWSEAIEVINTSLQDLAKNYSSNAVEFDLIISNPPWFEYAPSQPHNRHNQSRDHKRTVARQQSRLDLETLFSISATLLSDAGKLYLVLPISAESQVAHSASKVGLNHHKILKIISKPDTKPYAVLHQLTKQPCPFVEMDSLTLRQYDGNYTPQFKALCRAYYLNF